MKIKVLFLKTKLLFLKIKLLFIELQGIVRTIPAHIRITPDGISEKNCFMTRVLRIIRIFAITNTDKGVPSGFGRLRLYPVNLTQVMLP